MFSVLRPARQLRDQMFMITALTAKWFLVYRASPWIASSILDAIRAAAALGTSMGLAR